MSELRVRWHLELVDFDQGARKVLANDRAIRKSLQETDRAQSKAAKTATDAGAKRVRGSTNTATALLREGRAAKSTQRDVAQLNRAQAQALSAGSRLAASAQRVASGYRTQAAAARQATTAERARAAASSAASRISTGAATTGAGLTRASQATLAAAAGGGIAAKGIATFAGFEQQMDRVLAVSGATRAEFAALNAQAKKLGADTSFSAREAADGMYQLSTAGFSANEVMRTIPGTLSLAAASGTDLASAAELQATTLRGFGLAANQAGRVADALTVTVNRSAVEMYDLGDSLKYIAPVARATGQSMESMLAAIGLMGNVGVKGSQAGTTLRTALVRLTAPTEKSANALKELGLRGADLRGPKGLLPLPTILRKIVDGAQDMDKGTRNAAIAAIFGREALSGMIAMIDKGPDALERNIRALQRSEGAAKRTATIMRGNVSGAWDTFTGSLETAAITLTTRFGPALQRGLKSAASGINVVAATLGEVLAGAADGDDGAPRRSRPTRSPAIGEHAAELRAARGADARAAMARARSRTTSPSEHANELRSRQRNARRGADRDDEPSTARRIGTAIGGTLRTIAAGAVTAGTQLLDAFRPALPFFQNVLLPVLEGVGKSLLTTVVGAFRILVPVIKGIATVLGFIGTAAKPLAPVFRGIGAVIGFFVGGLVSIPAKGVAVVGFLSRFGMIGRVVGLGVKLMLLPLRLLSLAFTKIGPLILGAGRTAIAAGGRLARGVITALGVMPSRLANLAANAMSLLIGGLRAGVGKVRSVGSSIANGLLSFLVNLPGRLGALAGRLVSAFIGLGKKIANAVVQGIKAAPGLVVDAVKSLIPGPIKGAVSKVWHGLTGGRRGGIMRRRDGGLIPAAVSPGELVTYGDAAWTVPGPRSGADSFRTLLPAGAAVWTDSGQAMLAAGMAPADALAGQLPHFRAGGRVGASMYGGPSDGTTRKPERGYRGDLLEQKPMTYAELNMGKALGGLPYEHPLAISYRGRSVTARKRDIGRGGGAVEGRTRAIDLYYRVAARLGFSGLGVVSIAGADGAKDSTIKVAANVTANRRRAGLVDDALEQGRAAGLAGLSRAEIRQANRGRLGARANPIVGAIRGAQQTTTSDLNVPGAEGGTTTRGGKYAGGPPGVARSQLPYAQRKAVELGNRITSTTGGRHSKTSLHYAGRAFDSAGSASAMMRFARWAYGNYRRAILELYHRPSDVNTKNGQHVAKNFAGVLAAPDKHDGHVHLALRRGGRVGFRAGGPVGLAGVGPKLRGGVSRILSGGALTAMDELLGAAVELRMRTLRAALVRTVRKGGDAKTVQRLRGIIDLIDSELGRRIGVLERQVERRSARLDRGRAAGDRAMRTLGVDPDSAAGIRGAMATATVLELPAARANARDLRAALNRAKRAGAGREALDDLQSKLQAAQDEVDELLVTQVERRRALIRQQAQEGVDAAGFTLELAQAGVGAVDARQRQDRTADTPGGMLERADAIRSGVIPGIQAVIDAQGAQLAAAIATGDLAGSRSAHLALLSSGNDLANAIADAGELVRGAAQRAAQDLVDAASHGTTLATSGLQRLELEQRLAGTYEAGGVDRANFINTTIIPALQAELAAIDEQARVAREQGLVAELRTALEAGGAKTNEILQAQLDALEAVESNTKPRQFGGNLGFSYGDETLTDSLIATGNGA